MNGQHIFTGTKFHKAVIFFEGFSSFRNSCILNDSTALGDAQDLMSAQGNDIPLLVYKDNQTWRPSFRSHTVIKDAKFTGDTWVLAHFNNAILEISTGQMVWNVVGHANQVESKLRGNATWGTYGELIGILNSIYTFSTTGTLPLATGARSMFSPEEGANDTWTQAVGYKSHFNEYATGTLVVNEYIGFLSDLLAIGANTTITSGYHFYGKGDYPSYFGGAVINATQAVSGLSVTPTQVELESALGANQPDGWSKTVWDGDNNRLLKVHSYGGLFFYEILTQSL